MNLDNLRSADKAMKQTKIITIIWGVLITIAFTTSILILIQKIDDAYTKSYIFDNSGRVYSTTTVETKDMRSFEYENHVKMFFTKWYAFEETTYEDNIRDGLELIGDQGKELLNEYNDVNILNTMIQKNIRYTITITDVKVNMNTIPISGLIKGVQTGHRAKGSVSRNITATFTLYDVARSRKNVHGCKIDEWNVKYTTHTGEEENDTE